MSDAAARTSNPLASRIAASFRASLGDVVFGMADGAVSIFGLVEGVAAATTNAHFVLLTGAVGAAAAAVSMGAGAYLDASASRDVARAEIAGDLQRMLTDPDAGAAMLRERLAAHGAPLIAIDAIEQLARKEPNAWASLRMAIGPAGATGGNSPLSHAAWMFVADLTAALTPVLPFAFLPIDAARVVSLALTATMMALLGFARARIARTPAARTVLETLGIAGGAAVAGVAIGQLLG